jgi:hypothetical protein
MGAPFEAEPHRWLPLAIDAAPAFDSATQRVVPAGYIIEPAQVRKTWAVEPLPLKTQAEIWADKLAGTITDPVTGIAINANESTRNVLTGQLTMTLAALSAGAITPATPQDIWDAAGVKHTLTTAELIGLMLRYGAAWQALFAEFAP